MEPFKEWNRELSTRRDPAAHRIPLSVPPAFIDADTKDEYQRVSEDYATAVNDALSTQPTGKLRRRNVSE